MKVDKCEVVSWLMKNGGSAIRYRTATELAENKTDYDREKLLGELITSKPVEMWLSRCHPIPTPKHYRYALNAIHGSNETLFENVVPKLVQLGLHAGMPTFDEATAPFRKRLDEDVDRPYEDPFTLFYLTLLAAFLAMAGYENEDSVRTVLNIRLETLYDFTRQRSYDIYEDPKNCPSIPRFYRVNIVNPRLYENDKMMLPWIYDIIGFAAIYGKSRSTTKEKIDKVIEYILSPDYQSFPDGYGTMVVSKSRALAMGWSVHLPGFFGFQEIQPDFIWKSLVQRVALMANFTSTKEHSWFRESVRYLDSFSTEKGTYILPKHYITENKSGYWVSGQRMGLGENRREKLSYELESTFWVSKIKNLQHADF